MTSPFLPRQVVKLYHNYGNILPKMLIYTSVFSGIYILFHHNQAGFAYIKSENNNRLIGILSSDISNKALLSSNNIDELNSADTMLHGNGESEGNIL